MGFEPSWSLVLFDLLLILHSRFYNGKRVWKIVYLEEIY
jgi:hypothetical protein